MMKQQHFQGGAYTLPSGEEIREYSCSDCNYEWLEWCDSSDYPNYCPHCGISLDSRENDNDDFGFVRPFSVERAELAQVMEEMQ